MLALRVMLESVFGARSGADRAREVSGKERQIYGHLELSLDEGRRFHNPAPARLELKELNR